MTGPISGDCPHGNYAASCLRCRGTMVDLRWSNEDKLPEDVCAAMRDLLPEALREAATRADPGDGYMHILTAERILGEGMYSGGWKLQSSHVQDVRMNPSPFVVVHAYSDSQVTKGSVSADVVRTAADRRVIATAELDALVRQREELDQAITKLRTELECESA